MDGPQNILPADLAYQFAVVVDDQQPFVNAVQKDVGHIINIGMHVEGFHDIGHEVGGGALAHGLVVIGAAK